MYLQLVTPPGQYPVTLDETKNFLKVDESDPAENALVESMIHAITDTLDGPYGKLGRCLIEQTWEMSLPCFPTKIELPLPPVQEITSVKYTDRYGATSIVDPSVYELVKAGYTDTLIQLKVGQNWPEDLSLTVSNSVRVTFKSGYGASPNDVPRPLRIAILTHIAHVYENRSAINVGNITSELPLHFESLIAPYKVHRFN